jgi:predicted ATPase
LYQESYEEDISIELKVKGFEYKVHCNSNDLKIIIDSKMPLEPLINLFNDDFQYIMTDRISPQITYPLSELNIKKNLIGFKGEYTAHYISVNRHSKLNIIGLKHSNSITNQLMENVSLWLSEISAGIELSANVYNELQQVNLTYKYTYEGNTTNNYTPLNVGFGITYVLPIIVSILKAKPDDLLIIENPESHLHPVGQSKIAELCAIASANGVQIIVETHSDHFLNGIRVATKKGLLTSEQSKVYYFRKDKDKLETKIDEIQIDNNGGINNYPKGFFDQFDNDLDELLGL